MTTQIVHAFSPPRRRLRASAFNALRRAALTRPGTTTHPRIDAVDLARQGRQPLDPLRAGDLDLPAAALQRVMHEPRPIHRLDHRPDRDRAVTRTRPGARTRTRRQHRAVSRRPRRDRHPRRPGSIQPLAAEIQSSVQHQDGPPSALAPTGTRRSVPPAGGPHDIREHSSLEFAHIHHHGVPQISTAVSLIAIVAVLLVTTLASVIASKRDPGLRAHAGSLMPGRPTTGERPGGARM